jgi:hypothetical protein
MTGTNPILDTLIAERADPQWSGDSHQPAQEETVTPAQVSDAAAAIAALDTLITAVLDNPAAIAALGAAHVPAELLTPVATLLDSLAVAHPHAQ